jgi:hypothetical protein
MTQTLNSSNLFILLVTEEQSRRKGRLPAEDIFLGMHLALSFVRAITPR